MPSFSTTSIFLFLSMYSPEVEASNILFSIITFPLGLRTVNDLPFLPIISLLLILDVGLLITYWYLALGVLIWVTGILLSQCLVVRCKIT